MIKKILLNLTILIFTFMTLLAGCTSGFRESTKADYKDVKSNLIKYMDDYSKKNGFIGSIVVAKDNDILLNRGYGMADYDNNIFNAPKTVFEIGSITKQFTSTAIMQLQENKLLSVQDTISKYIPDYPSGDKIKIYNLLTQTSGIPEYLKFVESIESGKHTYNPEELIALFKNKPLDFDTGTLFRYSNSNYILLGYIIEKVSNMKYGDYIRKNILKPLKMNNTGFLSDKSAIKNKASGYLNSNSYVKTDEFENSLPYAAGEIYSTTEDLYKWSIALESGKVIKKESLNEMFTPYLQDYGYGWFINKSTNGDKIIFHGGDITGYTSYIMKDIDKKYTIIILTNKQSYNLNIIPVELLKILKNK